MNVSVTDPIGLAINRTGRILFKPFSARKWFVLGFCAWLAHLAEGGGNNINLPGGGPGPMPNTPQEWNQWLARNAYWVIPVVVGAVGLFALILWVRARGKFVFLEAVAQDQAAVVEPWKRLRPLANSFFFFDLLLYVGAFLALSLVVVGGLSVAYPDIQARQFGPGAWAALLGGLALLAGGALVFLLTRAIAEDFLVPLMYLRGQGIGPAWGEFRRAILPGNLGAVALFYLVQVGLGIAIGSAAMIVTCATCLLTILPYVGTVLLLPLIVFMRCYSLYFLAQFGNEYNLLVEAEPMRAFQVIMPAGPTAVEVPSAPPPLPPLPPEAGGEIR